jgi:hypothetical protein
MRSHQLTNPAATGLRCVLVAGTVFGRSHLCGYSIAWGASCTVPMRLCMCVYMCVLTPLAEMPTQACVAKRAAILLIEGSKNPSLRVQQSLLRGLFASGLLNGRSADQDACVCLSRLQQCCKTTAADASVCWACVLGLCALQLQHLLFRAAAAALPGCQACHTPGRVELGYFGGYRWHWYSATFPCVCSPNPNTSYSCRQVQHFS